MAAIEQARAQGLSGHELVAFVAQDQLAAESGLDQDIGAMKSGEHSITRAAMNATRQSDQQTDDWLTRDQFTYQPTHLPPEVTNEVDEMDLTGIELTSVEATSPTLSVAQAANGHDIARPR